MPILIGGLGTEIGCLQNCILYIVQLWIEKISLHCRLKNPVY